MKNVRRSISNIGGMLLASTPEYFRNYLKAETAKYAKLVEEVGLKTR